MHLKYLLVYTVIYSHSILLRCSAGNSRVRERLRQKDDDNETQQQQQSSRPHSYSNNNNNNVLPAAKAYLTTNVDTRARCLDGSSGVVWISPSPNNNNNSSSNHHNNNNWLIGSRYGGWCSLDVPINLTHLGQPEEHTVDHCYSRSLYYKGSNQNISAGDTVSNLLPIAGWADYVSRDPVVNPVLYDWNFAWIMYCDGTSLAGRRDDVLELDGPVGKRDIYFRGSYIRDAVLTILQEEFGLGSSMNPSYVILAGQSAGGLAAFLHINWWAEQLKTSAVKKVMGISDGGFFLDWDTSNTTSFGHEYFVESYRDQMRLLYQHTRADVNADCVQYYSATTRGEPWRCFMAQYVQPFVTHPIFVLNSQFDSWQLQQMLGYYSDKKYSAQINAYGNILANEIVNMVTHNNNNNKKYQKDVPKIISSTVMHGAFIDSCQHHLQHYQLKIDNVTRMEALSTWVKAHITKDWDGVQLIYYDKRKWPCAECCAESTNYVRTAGL